MPCYEIDGVVPVVDPSTFLHPQASLIGDVIVGPGCYLGPFASLRGDFGRIVVGAGANVQDSCVVHAYPGADAVLEDEAHIGHGAILHGCRIGRGTLVGMNAVVMDGVVLGDRCLVGACTFVRAGTEVPAGSMVVGNPARVRPMDEDTRSWLANGPKVYQELARRSLAGLREIEPLSEAEPDRSRVSTGPEVSRPLHERRSDAR